MIADKRKKSSPDDIKDSVVIPISRVVSGTTEIESPPRPLMLKGQLKVAQVWSDFAARGTTGYVYCLNKIAAGTDIDTRIGREIIMKHLTLRVAQAPALDTGYFDFLRVLVVYDTVSGAQTTSVGDILESAVIAPLALQPHNIYLYEGRFHYLLDHTFPLLQGGASLPLAGKNSRVFEINLPKKCQRVRWGGYVTDEPTLGGLFIVLAPYRLSATSSENLLSCYSSVLRWIDA